MAINLKRAKSILKKAVLKSEELNLHVAIAIFDSENDLVLFQKMDNTPDLCVKLSQAKALTALKLMNDTDKFSYLVTKNNGILSDIRYEESISLIGGGKIILENGRVIGALGISGGTEEQDVEVAAFAISDCV
ncbi:MAG: heme-binding protein [Synergistaceae bacterium]|nr:heme-binding protein [Synergistaceae bacterium]